MCVCVCDEGSEVGQDSVGCGFESQSVQQAAFAPLSIGLRVLGSVSALSALCLAPGREEKRRRACVCSRYLRSPSRSKLWGARGRGERAVQIPAMLGF